MANIARRPDGRWRARYRDPTGTEHSGHFDRKIDAQRWLDEMTTAMTSGTYVDPRRPKFTVHDWADRWLATKVDLKATTRCCRRFIAREHPAAVGKCVPLADVTHEGVASWVADLSAAGLSTATVRQAHRVLSLVLDLAVRDSRLARNPAERVPLPRAAKGEKVFLTHGQVEALAAVAGDSSTAVLFLAYTGVRWGELAALRVRRLDLLRRRAEIVESVAEVRGALVLSRCSATPQPR
jgi:integrase